MSAQKFIFNREFDKAPTANGIFVERRKEPTVTVEEHERRIAEAVQAAFQRGHAEGIAAARAEETARLAIAFEMMTTALLDATGRLGIIEDRASAEMTALSLAFARRLSGRLIDREPIEPIEDAARLAFQDLRGAPHIVARVAPQLVEAVKTRLARLAQELGIEGRLIVMGEPETDAGDCRIEWADGGVVRSRTDLDRRLSSAVESALAQSHSSRGGV
jgi:flagellar assembly protein FliH